MSGDTGDTTEGGFEPGMSPLAVRVQQGIVVFFVAVGLFMAFAVLTVPPEELARGAMGRREGMMRLILLTPLRFLLPLAMFGIAGYSYLELKEHA